MLKGEKWEKDDYFYEANKPHFKKTYHKWGGSSPLTECSYYVDPKVKSPNLVMLEMFEKYEAIIEKYAEGDTVVE